MVFCEVSRPEILVRHDASSLSGLAAQGAAVKMQVQTNTATARNPARHRVVSFTSTIHTAGPAPDAPAPD